MADVDAKAAKVAAAKKRLAAYRRKTKKPRKADAGEGEFSDTASEASYATSSDVASLASVDDRSTPDSEALADVTLQSQDTSVLEEQLTVYSNRLAVLEETIDGKDGAIMSLSEENARLMAELDTFKHEEINGAGLSNGDEKDTHKLQQTIQELTSHLQQYQAAVVQRDQAIQQISEQSRQLQEQNRQLQTPSRAASEDGLDYAAETESLKEQVALLQEQLEQANTSLSRQSAPSPLPIVEAKNEIITLQQNLAAQEQALQHLKSSLAERDSELNQLKSENAEKDLSIQALGVKISKKSEALSELSEEIDLFKAKDMENLQMINDLKAQAKANESTGGSDADSIASAGYSEEDLEEKQQELRNALDEQFGQNMMVIKESMSKQAAQQYEAAQSSLKKELEKTQQQVAHWEAWGQNAQSQFQQQLQQQLAALSHQLTQRHNEELLKVQQSANDSTAIAAGSDEPIARLREQHEEEMKVLVDTAEEEANSLKEQVRLLEQQLEQPDTSSTSRTDSAEPLALQEMINHLNDQVASSQTELDEVRDLYSSSKEQLAGLVLDCETKDSQLSQLSSQLESALDENKVLDEKLQSSEQLESAVNNERDNLKIQLEQLNVELDQSQSANSEMSAEVEGLREKCVLLVNTNEQLEKATTASNEKDIALTDLQNEKIDLLGRLSELTGRVDILQQNLAAKDELMDDLTVGQQESDVVKSELEATNNSLQERLANLEKIQAGREDDINLQLNSLVGENRELQESLGELSNVKIELERVSAESERLQNAQSELERVRELANEDMQTVRQELEETKVELEGVLHERQQLIEGNARLSELAVQLEAATKENQQLKDMQLQLDEKIRDFAPQNEKLGELEADLEEARSGLELASNEKQQLDETQAELDATKVQLKNALQEAQQLKDTQNALNEVRTQLEDASLKCEHLADTQQQLNRLAEQLSKLTEENEQLQRDKLLQLPEAASSDTVKEQLAALAGENQAYKAQLLDHEQLQQDSERYQNQLLLVEEKLESISNEYDAFKQKHSDYNDLKSQLEGLTSDLAIKATEMVQLEEARNELNLALEQSTQSNQLLHEELDSQNLQLTQSKDRFTELLTTMEELKHSNQIAIDELNLAKQSIVDELETKILASREENSSLLESSQVQLKALEEKLDSSQQQLHSQSNNLTHSFEEEKMILNFKIKDLEAKLEDSSTAARSDIQDEIKMAVVQALREQQMKLNMKHEQAIAEGLREKDREMETERKQIELMYDQKFIQQMNETRNELSKQSQRDIQELQQAYSNDATKQMQALYDQIQEKDKVLATLNKELAQSQDAITRLSEDTMAMEDLHLEKESLQAQLDKVQSELEDLDRVAPSAEWTDQDRLLRENPVFTDQVEDSGKYQSLVNENEQLTTLLEQLRESDAGKLRIAFEQLRQENEALREQLQHSMIPDRVEEQHTDSGKEEQHTDDDKEEIESLKKTLSEMAESRQQIADMYTGLHSQYTEIETQYREALDLASNQDVAEEVDALKAYCQTTDSHMKELLNEVETLRSDKERAVKELASAQEQSTGSMEAYQKLKSQSEAANESEMDKMRSRLFELENTLKSTREQTAQEQQAKNSVLSELEEAKTYIARSKETADDLLRLTQENEALHDTLSKAKEHSHSPIVHEMITPTHSTPRSETLPNSKAEMYDSTHHAERELSDDMSALRQDMDNLQVMYNRDTSDLRLDLEVERKNVVDLRQEMHESLNSSAHSLDSSNIANLTELVATLQGNNERLHCEKQELNKQLMEQEKLCEKLHERLKMTESLSSGVQDSYSNQLAAARRQRDEILQQLEEATKVNDQVTQLVAERNTMKQEQSGVKLRERDELDIELQKLRSQLESLTHAHSKLAENLSKKDEAGLELGKRNAILESAVQQMEARLRDSERAYQSEKQNAQSRGEEAHGASKRKADLEQKLTEEKTSYRNRLTAELQQARVASEKGKLLQIRQERLEIEKKYKEAIEKLRLELSDESKRRQETLRSHHAQQIKQMETQHEKQLKHVAESFERQMEELKSQLHQKQAAQPSAVEESSQHTEQQLQRLKEQFEKEVEMMRKVIDSTQHEQFDEMMRTHKLQLLQEKKLAQAEIQQQMEELKSSSEKAQAEDIASLTRTLNADKTQAINVLESELELQYGSAQSTLQQEFHIKMAQLEEQHNIALAELNSQHKINMADRHTELMNEVVDSYETQLKALATQHSKELSSLKDELEQKYAEEKFSIEETHLAQLKTARAQLVISDSLEKDYQELKADVNRLQMERDINAELMRKLAEERDALRQQALDSSQNLSRIHDEEMSELSRFFEEKLVESERVHIEEITQLKENYQLMLDASGSSPDYHKPYHTGDSMTESIRVKEAAKTKLYHTMTVLSDLDSSEGSPPLRMTEDELEKSMAKDKAERIADLEKEVDDLTLKLVETENRLAHHNTEIDKLSKEKDDLGSKLSSAEHKNAEMEDELNDHETKHEYAIIELQDLHKQKMEAEAGSHKQILSDYQEKMLAELTRSKLEIASLTGQMIEAQSSLEEARIAAEQKEEELQEAFKEELSALQAEYEQQMIVSLEQLRDSLQTTHAQAIADLEQRLQLEKQEELTQMSQQHAEDVLTHEDKYKSIRAEYDVKLEQLENEFKITVDSLQSEKQQAIDDLTRLEDHYGNLRTALQDGSAPEMVSLHEELTKAHQEEKVGLQRQYEENVGQLTDHYENKISALNALTEEQLLNLRAEHTNLLEKALKERQAHVEATIEEYEGKIQESKDNMRMEHQLALNELEVKFTVAVQAEQEASAQKLDALMVEHKIHMERKEKQFQLKLEEDHTLLKEQLLAERRSDIEEISNEIRDQSSTAMEQLLDSLRQEQADEILQLNENHEKELSEANQKVDDLDAAHTEELRILADEHDKQLEILREQLNIQLEKMSTELEALQTNHDCQLQQEKLAHNNLLEEALVEQHNNHEQDIARHNAANNGEREAWDSERLAHEAEIQSLQDQLNLERREYQCKVEESSRRVRELTSILDGERAQAKETSDLWTNNMAELRAEQDELKDDQRKALVALEERYQKQIDSLQNHLQRIVSENKAKDELIQQLRAESEELHQRVVKSTNPDDLVSQLKADLEHLKQTRDAVSGTNVRLLELLSGTVESQRSLEARILGKIGPAQGFDGDSRSTPVDRSSRPSSRTGGGIEPLPRAARASAYGAVAPSPRSGASNDDGTLTPHEKSFDSEMADEGLDMSHFSQTKEVSLFAGPNLNYSEEETVLDSGRHLQEVVNLLLSRIENTNAELADVKQEQQELLAQLSQRNSQIAELNRELTRSRNSHEELDDQIQQLTTENAELEPMRAELFQEKELCDELRTGKSEAEEQLVLAMETRDTLVEEVNALKAEREAVEELKAHVELQHQTMTDAASSSEQTQDSQEASQEELLRMNSQLESEKRTLQAQHEATLNVLHDRVKDLEAELQIARDEHEAERDTLSASIEELEEQVSSLIRTSQLDKQFMEQQTAEREVERDEAVQLEQELDALREKLNTHEGSTASLQAQLEEAEHSLQRTSLNHVAETEANKSDAEMALADLDEKEQTISRMREAVGTLEEELQGSVRREHELRQQLETVHNSQVDRTQYEEPSGPSNTRFMEDLGYRLEESLKALQVLREERDRLTEEIESYKITVEESNEERATLQSTVYEQMATISNLKSQLESVRHFGGSRPSDPSHVEQLAERLHMAKDSLERKELEMEQLAEELDMLQNKHAGSEEREGELKNELKSVQAHYENMLETERATNEQLNAELEVMKTTSNEMSINELMKALIRDKDEEIRQLQEKLSKETTDKAANPAVGNELKVLHDSLASKNTEVDELALALTAKSTKVEELELLLEAEKAETTSLVQYTNDLTSDFEKIQTLAEERESQLAAITRNVESLEEERSCLLDEKESLLQKIIALERETRESQNVIDEKEEEMYMLNEKVEELEKYKAESVQSHAEVSLQKEKLSETNKELAMEVNSLRKLAAEREHELTTSLEETRNTKAKCEDINARLTQSMEETDKYLLQCDELSKQLSESGAGDELIQAMIAEKSLLAQELEQAHQKCSQLSSEVAGAKTELPNTNEESLNELDTLREALLDTQSQYESLKAEHSQVMIERDPLQQGESIASSTAFSIEQSADLEDQQQTEIAQLTAQLQHSTDELKLTIGDRDNLVKEVSSLRDELETLTQYSSLVDKLKEEKVELELMLAASHDAQLVDEQLAELQTKLEAQLEVKDRELQEMSETTQEQIANQQESYEETITSLNERIIEMREEFEQEYERLKGQVLDEVSHRLHENLADETFSESLRKDIEGRIALITNGHGRDSDQDTLADTASVTSSTLGDEVPVKDRQKQHMDQIERESHSIYKLSHKAAAFGDSVLESVLQEKEVLNATIQSLKDLLSQVDESRATSQMNDSSPADWRAALIHGVHQVFQRERELYLQELRTFVAARGDIQPSEIERLESKLKALTARQEVSVDQLFQTDRQSLLDEIAEHRTLANNMKNETVQILNQLDRHKAEAKQQAQLNEAKQQQQIALIDDSNKALGAEQKRNSSLTQELSTLRDMCYSLETELASSHAEIEHAKQLLSTEQHKLASLQNQLSDERTKSNMLDMQLRQHTDEEQKLHQQMKALERERLVEREEGQNTAQIERIDLFDSLKTLRQEIQLLRDHSSELNTKLDRETLVHQTTKRQLIDTEHDAVNRERQIKSQVAQLELTLDMERAKQLEIVQELSQEKARSEGMKREIGELELRPPVTEYKVVCDELDSEKSRSLDIQSALDRERNRSSNLSAALDLSRAQALEEVENERRIVAQLKRDIKVKQRDLEDLRCQLQSERGTVMSLREEMSNLQTALEDSNTASFEAQKRLALEQAAMQHERDSLHETCNDLKKELADAEVAIAEKESVIESQHRDMTKMRNQLGRSLDESVDSPRSKNIYKRLRLIALRLKEASDNTQNELGDVFNELTMLNDALDGNIDAGSFASISESGRLLEFVEKLSKEKEELRHALSQLEAEIQRYRQREDNQLISPPPSQGLSSYWLAVVNDLYSRMRKAEARVRGLTYQKKVVLLQLGGYEECEEEVLQRLTSMGALNTAAQTTRPTPLRKFRAAVKVVITTRRLRWLVCRSRKLVRDGVQSLIRNSHDDKSVSQYNTRPQTTPTPSHSQSHQALRPNSRTMSSRPDSSKGASTGSRSHMVQQATNYPPSEASHVSSTVYGTDNHRASELPSKSCRKSNNSKTSLSSRSPSVQSSRPPSQQSVQSSVSRQSHRALNADGNRKGSKASLRVSSNEEQRSGSPGSQRSLTPLASYTKPGSASSQRSAGGRRSTTPIGSQRSASPRTVSPRTVSPRTVSPRTVSPTVQVNTHHSRSHTPKTSSRASPVPRESQSSPMLSTGSYNPSRHARCFPQDVYDRPIVNRVSHDDSVVENINRLERLQERLSEMQRPT